MTTVEVISYISFLVWCLATVFTVMIPAIQDVHLPAGVPPYLAPLWACIIIGVFLANVSFEEAPIWMLIPIAFQAHMLSAIKKNWTRPQTDIEEINEDIRRDVRKLLIITLVSFTVCAVAYIHKQSLKLEPTIASPTKLVV